MTVRFERKGRIALVTINRPEAMNAIDMETNQLMAKVWDEFRDDPELWVAILTGAGEKAFCAGADLKKLIPMKGDLTDPKRGRSLGGLTRRFDLFKPIIAAVNGYCIAGGLEILLCCDIRIAAEHASFGLQETRWGIMPGGGGTQRLPRMIPFCKAMELILLAERIDAQEAHRIGLVNRVVPADRLMDEAFEVAETLLERGPLALRAAKESVLRGLSLPLEDGLRYENFMQETLRDTEDRVEGPKAFAEKRKPEFKGG